MTPTRWERFARASRTPLGITGWVVALVAVGAPTAYAVAADVRVTNTRAEPVPAQVIGPVVTSDRPFQQLVHPGHYSGSEACDAVGSSSPQGHKVPKRTRRSWRGLPGGLSPAISAIARMFPVFAGAGLFEGTYTRDGRSRAPGRRAAGQRDWWQTSAKGALTSVGDVADPAPIGRVDAQPSMAAPEEDQDH